MSQFFGKKPFFQTQPLTLSQIFAAFVASARTFSESITITKTAQAGTAEGPLFKIGTSDDSTGRYEVHNGAVTDAFFIPYFRHYGSSTNNCGFYYYFAQTDSGSNALLLNDFRTIGNAAIATRPLWGINNNGSRIVTWWPTGLMIGSSLTAAPRNNTKLELAGTHTQLSVGTGASAQGYFGANGTIGAHLMWRATHDDTQYLARAASAAGIVLGSSAVTCFMNSSLTPDAAFSPTSVWTATSTGLGVNATPNCRFTVNGAAQFQGTGAPTSGAGIEVVGGSYTMRAYDRGASSYQTFTLEGSSIVLYAGGANRITADSTRIDAALPVRFPSFTPGTLPSAATHARSIVQVASTARGDRMARSNGTNWVYCEDEATTVTA